MKEQEKTKRCSICHVQVMLGAIYNIMNENAFTEMTAVFQNTITIVV